MGEAETGGPQPRLWLSDVVRYKAGESETPGVSDPVKLSANENSLGCSPHARQAVTAAAQRLAIYPDSEAWALRDAIARTHGLEPERIVCGAGSDELLQLLARGYVGQGDEVIHSAHSFSLYPICALQAGATPVSAAEKDLTADVDAILATVNQRTRMVYLANPNNPTGTMLPNAEIARLHAGLPDDVLLVLDGAYAEYVERSDYDGGVALAGSAANVVMTRTFSKIHGLASMRLGWAYGPEGVIDTLERLRGPFNVGGAAQAAGIAAIRDTDFLARSLHHNAREMAYVTGVVAQLGVLAAPSSGNFVLLRFPKEPGRTAKDADAFLRRRGFILRLVGASGLPDCLRMTLGGAEVNRAVMSALTEFVNAA